MASLEAGFIDEEGEGEASVVVIVGAEAEILRVDSEVGGDDSLIGSAVLSVGPGVGGSVSISGKDEETDRGEVASRRGERGAGDVDLLLLSTRRPALAEGSRDRDGAGCLDASTSTSIVAVLSRAFSSGSVRWLDTSFGCGSSAATTLDESDFDDMDAALALRGTSSRFDCEFAAATSSRLALFSDSTIRRALRRASFSSLAIRSSSSTSARLIRSTFTILFA